MIFDSKKKKKKINKQTNKQTEGNNSFYFRIFFSLVIYIQLSFCFNKLGFIQPSLPFSINPLSIPFVRIH